MVGELDFSQNKLTYRKEKISWKKGETIKVLYGLGYFQKEATFLRED
jgi:hypothetical protein